MAAHSVRTWFSGREEETMGEQTGIGKGFKWAWASRAVSLAINVVYLGYLTYYCTDVVGMSAALVGGLLLGSKVFDGVTDIIAGLLIDRTHTKWGQARPYQFFILPCWLFTILIFAVPNIGVVGQSVYVFLLYTMINSVCATFLNGSDAIFLARCVKSDKEKVGVTALAGALSVVGCVIVSIALPALIEMVGVSAGKWTVMTAAFGVPLGVLGMARMIFCKEYSQTEEEKKQTMEKIPFWTSLKLLAKNRYIIILTLILMLFYVQSNLFTATQTYYFKYIVGKISLASVVGAANLIVPVVIMAIPKLSKRFGSVACLRYGMIIGTAGFILRTIGGTNVVTLILGTVLSLISSVPISAMINIYIVDCMDYGAWKLNKRIDGLISSISAFGKKIGAAAASGLVGLIMGNAGYDGTLAVQSAQANTAIIVLFNYIPLAVTVVMLILSYLYDIDKLLPRIHSELGREG